MKTQKVKEYLRCDFSTEEIRGFADELSRKNGQHHHYSKKYTDKYIGEAVFKYNHRNESGEEIFDRILERTLNV